MKEKTLNWTPDTTEKLEVLIEELNQLWSFVQRYIDEGVVDKIMLIRTGEVGFREKMNVMDWLARNTEFLSPHSITKCLTVYKELYKTDNVGIKNSYI